MRMTTLMRQTSEGWGKLARDLGYKNLGSVVKSAKATEKETNVAMEGSDKPDKSGKMEAREVGQAREAGAARETGEGREAGPVVTGHHREQTRDAASWTRDGSRAGPARRGARPGRGRALGEVFDLGQLLGR